RMPASMTGHETTTTGALGRGGPPDPLGYSLVVCSSAGVSVHPLPTVGTAVIGRATGCDIEVKDTSISRRHAAIHIGHALELEDLGSHNGTLVHGRRLAAHERVELNAGSVVQIGSVTAVVQAAGGRPAGVPSDVVLQDSKMRDLYLVLDLIAEGTI